MSTNSISDVREFEYVPPQGQNPNVVISHWLLRALGGSDSNGRIFEFDF